MMPAITRVALNRAIVELAAKADPTCAEPINGYIDGTLYRWPKHAGTRLPDHIKPVLKHAARALRNIRIKSGGL
jgi:hypothetical protein